MEVKEKKAPSNSPNYFQILDYFLIILAGFYILVCPYTKVEESFNLQACHDILYHGSDIEKYDHHEFPGVVPRTFLGPLAVSSIAFPLVSFIQMLDLSKVYSQYVVRCVLGALVLWGFFSYRSAVKERLGGQLDLWLTLLTVSQFHFVFYCSRPLPNIFALVLVLHALAAWLKGQSTRFIVLSAGAILIFRGELAIFLGAILFMELIVGRISLSHLIFIGMCSLLTWIPLTVIVDSWFWQRTLWPEMEVLYYNIVLNKSSDWGVMPFAWYFYSALPRSLASTFLLLPLAPYVDLRTSMLLFPSFVFIFLYSFLPHKELRFIIYCLPVLNTAAAGVCHQFWTNWNKSVFNKLLVLGIVAHLILNMFCSAGLLYISRQNYPGGQAMHNLHLLEDSNSPVKVHLDVFACQTGVSRFTQINSGWIYDKSENVSTESMSSFSHILLPGHHKYTLQLKPFLQTHEFVSEIEAFSQIKLDYSTFPPVQVETKPAIFILRRKNWKP